MSGWVTQQEANLLTVARAALGVAGPTDLTRLLVTSLTPPAKLGPTARGLLQDTLARGTVLSLARGGGWAEGHHGRLWERQSQPPKLEFTGSMIRLLQWVLKTPLAEYDVAPLVLERGLTPAEEVVAALLLQRVKGTACETTVARQSVFRASPLVVLMHAGTLALAHSLTKIPPIRLADHATAIVGLRDVLARSWAAAEGLSAELDRPEQVTRLGQAQGAVIAEFFKALGHRLEHRVLAGFLVDAAGQWLSTPRTANSYVASLNPTAPMRDRVEARRSAGALVRSMGQLRTWDHEHRAMHFIDDDFAQGQALVRDWAGFGDAGFRAAELLAGELDALPT